MLWKNLQNATFTSLGFCCFLAEKGFEKRENDADDDDDDGQ